MKLTSISINGKPTPAALLANGRFVDLAAAASAGLLGDSQVSRLEDVIDLDGPVIGATRDLVGKLEGGDATLSDRLASTGALIDGANATYAPMLRPGLIVACGMAYHKHMEEMGTPIPAKPTGFMKSPNAIIANNEPLMLPATDPEMVDYECELACVIGRPLFNATPEEALASIVGYTMMNDVGSRSAVTAWLNSMEGTDARASVGLFTATVYDKQYPGFAPLGPVIETADTFGDPTDFVIHSRLNGELVQTGEASDLIFPVAESLAFFSRWYKFMPGDVYSTGSPAGVGFAMDPPRMLQVGDVIEVSCPKIGALANPVVAG